MREQGCKSCDFRRKLMSKEKVSNIKVADNEKINNFTFFREKCKKTTCFLFSRFHIILMKLRESIPFCA